MPVNPIRIRTDLFWFLKDSAGADLVIGGNGWEVPKLSWNLIQGVPKKIVHRDFFIQYMHQLAYVSNKICTCITLNESVS